MRMVWFRCVARELVARWGSRNRVVCCKSAKASNRGKSKIRDKPLGRLDRSTSNTMSMVNSICKTHSPPAGQIGRTSTAMLCQDESKSLCPSSRLAMPALPLHGRSLRKGVKFSVQTTSCGSTPKRRCVFASVKLGWSPSGWKDMTGRVVRVPSIKLSDAQKRPERAFVNVSHLWSALSIPSIS